MVEPNLPPKIDPQAFLSLLAPPRRVLPHSELPLVRHYLNTNLSGSSENVETGGLPRVSASEAVHQLRTQVRTPCNVGLYAGSVEDESDMPTSDLSGCDMELFTWDPRVRVLITRLRPMLYQHLDERCEPRLVSEIFGWILDLLYELFPEEVGHKSLTRDLIEILCSYTLKNLIECVGDLTFDVEFLFFSYINLLPESDEEEYFDEDLRDQARDDELASVTVGYQDKDNNENDMTCTLSDSGLSIQGHSYTETHAPRPPSPSLSPPFVNIINLTLSESRPLDENAVSEKSEDFSHSSTVDAVSETTSCTASDLSDTHPPQQNQLTLPDSCLSQGSFTLLVPDSRQQEDSLSTSKSDFIAEVLSLSSPENRVEGRLPY